HAAADDQTTPLQGRQADVLRHHVDAVAGRARQDGRLHRAIAANDCQRVAHVIEELATEGAVHTVVQVVPPAAVAARPPHYAADRGDGRCNDEAPGFRQHL